MKAGIVFTGTGPILILTSYDSFTNEKFIEKLKTKGILKFIVYELPFEKVREKYGMHFSVVMGDLHENNDLRVLDYNGHHIFTNFSFADMGEAIQYEASKP